MIPSNPEPAVDAVKWLRDKADQKLHAAAALVGQIEQMQARVLKLRSDAEQHQEWADAFAALLLGGEDEDV